MAHEAKSFYEKNHKATFWTNSMFGGMPTYTIFDGQSKNSVLDYILNVFSFFSDGPLNYYLVLVLGSFAGLCLFGIGPYLSLIGALVITFSANHIGLLDAGHLTKIATLGFIPVVLAGSYQLYQRKWIPGFVVLSFGFGALINRNHIQMAYLAAIALAVFVIAACLKFIKEKDWTSLTKLAGLHLGAMLLGGLLNLGLLTGLKDYAKDTMRGGSILSVSNAKSADINTASGENGLGWDYAMQWSNGPADILNLFAAGAVGGSSSEPVAAKSELGRMFRASGGKDVKLPMYWGSLPFTSGPDYMSIIILLFFLIGLVTIKGPFKWFGLISSILLIILSMGKHFAMINHPIFDYLPYFNKFRTPNSILNVLSVTLPVFSLFAMYQFMKQSWTVPDLLNLFKKTALPLAVFLLFIAVLGPAFFDMKSDSDAQVFGQNQQAYDVMLSARASYMRAEFFRSFIFLGLASILLYLYATQKIKSVVFASGVGLLILIDLWIVDKRYISTSDFQTKKELGSLFNPRPVDSEILKDQDLYYRVHDLSANPFNSASASYYHKTIGGYHPAKLRRYQDMIDYYIAKGDSKVLNMLNTKYIIDQSGKLNVNGGALGNAWFVSGIKSVNSPDEEIAAIANSNPADEAIVLKSEFAKYHLPSAFNKNGSIMLTSYAPNKLTYHSESGNEQLVVFSDVWYGPNKGWQASIDGKPVDHIRANYLLRAMTIPAGSHEIVFEFNPPASLFFAKNVSWILGSVFGLGLLVFIGWQIKKWIDSDVQIQDSLPVAPMLAKTISKVNVPGTKSPQGPSSPIKKNPKK